MVSFIHFFYIRTGYRNSIRFSLTHLEIRLSEMRAQDFPEKVFAEPIFVAQRGRAAAQIHRFLKGSENKLKKSDWKGLLHIVKSSLGHELFL